jgi:DNA-binding PucR family transcriptional regulator
VDFPAPLSPRSAAIAINEEVEAAAHADSRLPLTGLEPPATEAALLTVLELVCLGRQSEVAPPRETVDQVRLAVRQGTPIDSIVRVIWMCHAGVQDRLLAVIGENVTPDRVVDEVRELTRDLEVFADLMARELSAAYEAERAIWQNRMTAARRQVVDDIVGTGQAPEDAEQILGLPLTGHHMAALVWRNGLLPGEQAQTEQRHYLTRLTSAVGARNAVVLDNQDGSISVLWSFPAPPEPTLTEVVRAVARPVGTALALGSVGSGVSGLQRSVLGARQARAVAERCRLAEVSLYDDCALLALLLADEDAAGRFVRSVLAGLTGRDAKSAAIRETLAAYLRHGRGRTAAGAELQLAANTVAYRVRQAEEALGRQATERALDTLVALTLAAELPDLLAD